MHPPRGGRRVLELRVILLSGVLLVCLTVYVSTLSFVTRLYSRARLAERLPSRLSPDEQDHWVAWIERHETELQVLMSFLRAALNLGLLLWVWAWLGAIWPAAGAWTIALPALLALALIAIFAIGLPHALALHAGEAILARSLGLIALLRVLFLPVVRLLMAIDALVRRMLGRSETAQEDQSERKEQQILDAVSEGETHGAVDEEQKQMIESVFELKETTVSEIMTPRTEVTAIRADANFEEARELVVTGGHSRIPVYEESLDHIIGMLYAKDLLGVREPDGFQVRQIMRLVPYVPETKTVKELLRELRQQKVHIALVLDEYGGTAGLVTIEDIIELLIGDIQDEFDEPEISAIEKIDDETIELDGRTRVHELNERFHYDLPEEGDYETIGGFLLAKMARIPAVGETFDHENLHFEVTDAEPRRINRLRIRVRKPADPTPA